MCITMVMAAGKYAGKPPSMTDKACKPPPEAAMAMTQRAGSHWELFMVSDESILPQH
jgi:hypothetical protein